MAHWRIEDKELVRKIQKNRVVMCEKIELDIMLWAHLQEKEVVNCMTKEMIQAGSRPRYNQVEQLLDHLIKGSSMSRRRFFECLISSDQEHIVDHVIGHELPTVQPYGPLPGQSQLESVQPGPMRQTTLSAAPNVYSATNVQHMQRQAYIAEHDAHQIVIRLDGGSEGPIGHPKVTDPVSAAFHMGIAGLQCQQSMQQTAARQTMEHEWQNRQEVFIGEAPSARTSTEGQEKAATDQHIEGQSAEQSVGQTGQKMAPSDVNQASSATKRATIPKSGDEPPAKISRDDQSTEDVGMSHLIDDPTGYIKRLQPIAEKVNSFMADVQHKKPVKIALIDSGIKLNHPVISQLPDAEKRKISAVNLFDPDNAEGLKNIDDDHETGHGTSMYGVISSIVSMVNGLVEFVIIKAIKKGQGLTQEMLCKAIQYLLSPNMEDVSVVCLAYAIYEEPTLETMKAVLELCETKVFICAVSNDGNWETDKIAYPASAAIGVGSCDASGVRSSFSPQGLGLFCLGIGEDIQTLNANWEGCDSHYVKEHGTSHATAWVSAVACMCLLPLQREEFAGKDWPEKLKKTRYMKNLLRLMARDNKFTVEEGYGPIEPRKIFKDFDSYFGAALKACTNNK